MYLKGKKRWWPLLIAILLSFVTYSILSYVGVFTSGVLVSSAFPDSIFGNTTSGDRSYSLENSSISVDKKRRTYFVWEQEEAGNTDIAFARYGYNLDNDFTCAIGVGDNTISTSVDGDRREPDVAVNENGLFVVVWSDSSSAVATVGYDIVFSLYDSDCNPISTETLVNTYTVGDQVNPAVSIDNDGNFVVVWQGPCDNDADVVADDDVGVCARAFNNLGVAIDATEYLVNTTTVGDQVNPDVALDILGTGEFVVVWNGNGVEDDAGVYLQGYSNYGTPVSGGNQLVNITTTGRQANPAVAASKGAATLRYVVVWDGQGGADADGIYARRGTGCSILECPFSNTELSVNTTTLAAQWNATVDMDYQGDFVVSWRGGDYGEAIKGQFFTYAGALIGSELSVSNNGFTALSAEDLGAPVVGLSSDGYTVISNDYCVTGCDNPDTATLKWKGQGYQGFLYRTGTNLASANYSTYQLGGVTDIDTAVNQSDGSYVVVWSGNGDDDLGHTDTQGIWFSLIDRDGNVINSKQNVKVNTLTAGNQNSPSVSMFKDDGSFVICFDGAGDIDGDSVADDDAGVFYRRYDAQGDYLDTYDVMINDATTDTYADCDVAAGTSGEFIVTAENQTQDDVFISREGLGTPGTEEYPVLDIGAAYRRNPTISMDSSNNFVAVWESNYYAPFDSEIHHMKGTAETGFDAGVTENYLNNPTGAQSDPDVVLSENGRWFVVWQGEGVDDSAGIYMRQFYLGDPGSPSGSGSGADYLVNETVTDNQITPAITSDEADNLVITWLSDYGPMSQNAIARWVYWDNNCCFTPKSPEFLLDEEHFSVTAANEYGPTHSAVALYTAGDLYVFNRARDSYGYNIYGSEKKLLIGDAPILSSTLEQEILSGGRTLVVPDNLQFQAVTATTQSAVTNTIAFEDNTASVVQYVEVQDLFADGNAYNVTLSISTPFTFTGMASGCTTDVYCISDSSLEVRNYDQDGDRVTTVFGDSAAFELNSSTDSFATLSSQRTLATGTGRSVGRWRFYPELRLTVEPNVPPGTHNAVLTFSLN